MAGRVGVEHACAAISGVCSVAGRELIETVTAQHRTDAGVVRTQADAEITHHTIEPPTEVSCDVDTGTTKQK